MLQQAIVIALLISAAVYLGFKFFGKKNRGKCSCGCTGCASKNWGFPDSSDSPESAACFAQNSGQCSGQNPGGKQL